MPAPFGTCPDTKEPGRGACQYPRPHSGKHGNSNDPIPNQQAMWHVEEEEEEKEEKEEEEEEEEEEE